MRQPSPARSVPLLLAALLALAPAPARAADQVAILGGRIFDGSGGPAQPLGLLLMREGRIAEILPPDATRIAELRHAWGPDHAGVSILDGSGCTVLPGLIDLHTHISVPGATYMLMLPDAERENLASQLSCGVTRVLDLHAEPASIFSLREAARTDPALATLHAVGGAFTAPGGHPTQFGVDISNTVTSEEDVEARFAALLPQRPDAIKAVIEHGGWGGLPALPALDLQLASAIGAHARVSKLPLLVHIWTLEEARTAVAAHARALVHGVYLGEVDDALAAAMKRAGTAYVPTLAVVFGGARSAAGARPYTGPLAQQALHPSVFEALNDEGQIAMLASNPLTAMVRDGGDTRALANLKRLADAGVALGLGTDAGNPFTPHGPAALLELQLYVEAGLSPAQALAAATSGNAAILGIDGDVGRLVPGAIADVLVVRGDPTADITAMWDIAEVFKAGARVDRAAQAQRNAARRRAAVTRGVGSDLPARLFDGTPPGAAAAWPGAWEAYADTLAPGGKSSCELRWLEDAEGQRLRIEGTLAAGFPYGAFAGAAVLWDPERKLLADAAAHTGLRLRVRGTPRPCNLSVQCAAVKDWNVFAVPLPVNEEWAEVEIPFASLRQIGYGAPVTWTGTDITGLSLEARNHPFATPVHGPFTLEVDWIEVY